MSKLPSISFHTIIHTLGIQ